MMNKRTEILSEARRSLETGTMTTSERNELLTLLDILLQAAEKVSPDHEIENETSTLIDNVISNHSLLSLLKQQTVELDALRKLSLNLSSTLDLPTVLDAVANEARRLVEHTRSVHIYLYKTGRLEFGSALNVNHNASGALPFPSEEILTRHIVRDGKITMVGSMRGSSFFKDIHPNWEGSILGLPLKMGNAVVGVMTLCRTQTGDFPSDEVRLLTMLADQAAVAISNARLHQLLSRKAYTDTVTGLPNRRALDERVEQEIGLSRRTNIPFALVMMDLDGFKSVNDTYGHDLGDQVLRVFFNYMAQGLRSNDFLARYGGDELTLILSQTDLSPTMLVTEKILEKLHLFHFTAPDGNRIQLGLSGGIAIFPTHGRTGTDILRAADEALYRAKRTKRGSFAVAKALTAPLNR